MINYLIIFLYLFFFLVSCYGIGVFVLKSIQIDEDKSIKPALEILAITIGMGSNAYLTLFLGLIGLLNKFAIIVIMFIFFLYGSYYFYFRQLHQLENSSSRPVEVFFQLSIYYKLIVLSIITLMLFSLFGSLSPPLVIDDLKYHFAIPKRYVDSGAITYLADFGWSNLPFTMEMIWTLAISIHSAEFAQVINWSIGILVILWIKKCCDNFSFNIYVTIYSIFFFYTITTVFNISQSGLVELGSTLFFISGLYCLFISESDFLNIRIIFISGILIGFFASTKILFIAMASILCIIFCIQNWLKSRSLKELFERTLSLSIPVVVIPGVWYLKAWFLTGNPFYPLYIEIFGGPILNYELLGFLSEEQLLLAKSGDATSNVEKGNYFDFIFNLVAGQNIIRGHISPFFLGLIPGIFIYYKDFDVRLKICCVISFFYFLIWIYLYPFIRVGLPMLSLFAIIIANTFFFLLKQNFYSKIVLKTLVIMWLGNSLSSALMSTHYKLNVVLGNESKGDYLNRVGAYKKYNFFSYPAHKYINETLEEGATILLWSNDGLYLDRKYFYTIEFMTRMANPKTLLEKELVISELKRFGITHVAMTDNHLRKPLRNVLEETGLLTTIYDDGYMTIASLP